MVAKLSRLTFANSLLDSKVFQHERDPGRRKRRQSLHSTLEILDEVIYKNIGLSFVRVLEFIVKYGELFQ